MIAIQRRDPRVVWCRSIEGEARRDLDETIAAVVREDGHSEYWIAVDPNVACAGERLKELRFVELDTQPIANLTLLRYQRI